MNRKQRLKKQQDLSGALEAPHAASLLEQGSPARRNRRGIFGLVKTGFGVVVAATGAAVLFKNNSSTAYADSLGTFSSSVSGTPAVTVTGTNGATGVQISCDTGKGLSSTSEYTAVVGSSTLGSGVEGYSSSPAGNGVYGNSPYIGVGGVTNANTGIGVYGSNGSDSGLAMYAYTATGAGLLAKGGIYGVLGVGGPGPGVWGVSDNGNNGVYGESTSGNAVYGNSTSGIGVYGSSGSALGGYFSSSSGLGLLAYSGNSTAILAAGYPDAADFYGNVYVSGNLSKGGGSFLIDHPQDPANKSLYHSFVESPDMKNIYDGVVQLDSKGEAEVILPSWFGVLNTDFRYQLTAIGASAPNLYVAQKIQNNQFKIAGGTAGLGVSWLVTGIRQDAWAKAHRIPVEENKPATQKGLYHHPELYGEPEEKAIIYHSRPKPRIPPTPSSPPKMHP